MITIMTKWNSVYTIVKNPRIEHSQETGRVLARELIDQVMGNLQRPELLKPLYEYFAFHRMSAENNIRACTKKDMDDHAQCEKDGFGETSWISINYHQIAFAEKVTDGLIEFLKEVTQSMAEAKQRESTEGEIWYTKAIENHGGIVFGQGGGARGGFEFEMECKANKDNSFGGTKGKGKEKSTTFGASGLSTTGFDISFGGMKDKGNANSTTFGTSGKGTEKSTTFGPSGSSSSGSIFGEKKGEGDDTSGVQAASVLAMSGLSVSGPGLASPIKFNSRKPDGTS